MKKYKITGLDLGFWPLCGALFFISSASMLLGYRLGIYTADSHNIMTGIIHMLANERISIIILIDLVFNIFILPLLLFESYE